MGAISASTCAAACGGSAMVCSVTRRAFQTWTSPAITRAQSNGRRCLVSRAEPRNLPPTGRGHADRGGELGDRELRDRRCAVAGDLQGPVPEQHVRLVHRCVRHRRGVVAGVRLAPLGGELELAGLGQALGAVGDLGGGQQRLVRGQGPR